MARLNTDGIVVADGIDNAAPDRAARLRQRAEADAAASWGQWAGDIGARLSKIETKMVALVGDESGQVPGVGDPALFTIVSEFVDDERKQRAESVAKIVDAWTARLEAEVAVLDERWTALIDAKIFDLASLRAFKGGVDNAVEGLRNAAAEMDTRLAQFAERIDNVDRRRRGDRNTVHKEVGELTAKLAAAEAKAAGLTIKEWRLDEEGYAITPLMADGSTGAKLDLRPIFKRFFDEVAPDNR